jgi:hypothetical protein
VSRTLLDGLVGFGVWCGISLVAVLLFTAGGKVFDYARDRVGWYSTARELVHTDTRMFAECLRLSIAHFRALNRMRERGGRR